MSTKSSFLKVTFSIYYNTTVRPDSYIFKSLRKYIDASLVPGDLPKRVLEVTIHNRVHDLIKKLKLLTAI